MRQYKIIIRNLLILPIINFAFALPIAVPRTPQVGVGAVPDVTINSAKWADKMKEQWGMYFERVHGKPESDLEGLKGLLHYGPELAKAPSLDHYVVPPELKKSPSLDHFVLSPQPSDPPPLSLYLKPKPSNSPPVDLFMGSTDSEAGLSSPMEKPESTSFLSKVVSKVKFWRRISGPGPVRNAVNAA